MDTAQIVVTVSGMLAVAWVVWFFFLGEKTQTRAVEMAGGAQEIKPEGKQS
jgi:hypothetical protein